MATSTLLTERVDGINGYVNIPAANNSLLWRNGSGVMGTLPIASLGTLSGDNEWTGINSFNLPVSFGDTVEFADTATASFTANSKASFLTGLGLSTAAKTDAQNIFTLKNTFNGETQYGSTASFTYADDTVRGLHRSSLGLGTLATQNGNISNYGSLSNANTWNAKQEIYIAGTTGNALVVAAEDEDYDVSELLLRVIRQDSGSGGMFFNLFTVNGAGNLYTMGGISSGAVVSSSVIVATGNITTGGKFVSSGTPAYANDAAADADATLPSGGFYTITGSRAVYRKP